MIDTVGRAKYIEQQKQKSLTKGMKDVLVSALKQNGGQNEEVLRLVVKKEEDAEQVALLGKIGQALAKIYAKIPSQIQFPKIQSITGFVRAEVIQMPPVKITNFAEVTKYLQAIEIRLGQLATAISMISTQKPSTPLVKVPKIDVSPIVDAINSIPQPKAVESNNEDMLYKILLGINALVEKPVMVPNPVTHVSLNSLNGAVKTSQIQLGSTVTALPAVALVNRRSLQIYNNGANTIYLGGSTVTTATGIPVSAASFSDSFDFGVNAVLYGVSASGQNNDVRALEVSDEGSGR